MPASTPRPSSSKPNQSIYGRAPSPPLLRPVPIRPKPATLQRPSSRRPASPSRIQPPPLSTSVPRPSPSYRFPTSPSSRPRSSSAPRRASPLRPSPSSRSSHPPAHLSFLNPQTPIPPLDRSKYETGSTIPGTNLVLAPNTSSPRIGLAYWLRWVSDKLCDAIEGSVSVQREVWTTLTGSKDPEKERKMVEKEVRVIVQAALGLLRFYDSIKETYRGHVEVAVRYVRIRWGDGEAWERVMKLYEETVASQSRETRQGVLALRDLLSNAYKHHELFVREWKAHFDESRPPPDSYLRVTKDLYHSYMYTRRLYDSWSSESSGEPLSLSLRRRAQQMADKQAWFMLNRRARALLEGVKLIQDAQERLVDHLTTYLDVTRSRNGISIIDYLEYYALLQPLLPSSSTARPKLRLIPRPSSARRPSPTRTFPRGILRDPSPEGAFEGRGGRVGRSVRPYSPFDSRPSSVERYGRTG